MGANRRPKGMLEGRAEARAEGVLEGRRDVVLKQLGLKFVPLDDRVRGILANASLEELDAMVERVLTAATLDDVLG